MNKRNLSRLGLTVVGILAALAVAVGPGLGAGGHRTVLTPSLSDTLGGTTTGERGTMSIDVTNYGFRDDQAAKNVVIKLTLPKGFSITKPPSTGHASARGWTWNLSNDLPPAESATASFGIQAPSTCVGRVSATLTVSASNAKTKVAKDTFSIVTTPHAPYDGGCPAAGSPNNV